MKRSRTPVALTMAVTLMLGAVGAARGAPEESPHGLAGANPHGAAGANPHAAAGENPHGAPRESPYAAWSAAGHNIVCEIAFQRLTDQARDLVFEIRDQDPAAGQTFYRSCGWADSSRYDDHKATYEYHFMNVVVPDAPEMIMQRDCANYDCVQVAIVRYAHYTAIDPGNSESMQIRRANALKFVGHFVGDLHQPVHVGYAHDRGANDIYVDFYDVEDQRLHGVWDFQIPDRMGLYDDPIATARQLNNDITDAEVAAWSNFDVVGWSRESYAIVKELVYDIPADGRLGDSYFDRAAPLVEQRFKQAGVRLAFLLNNAAAGTLDFPPLFEPSESY